MVCLCKICKRDTNSETSKRKGGKLPRRNTIAGGLETLRMNKTQSPKSDKRNKSALTDRCQRRTKAGPRARPPSPDNDDIWNVNILGKVEPYLQEDKVQSEEESSDSEREIKFPSPRRKKEMKNSFTQSNAEINGNPMDNDQGGSKISESDEEVSTVRNQSRTKTIKKVITEKPQTCVKSAGPGKNRTKKIEAAIKQMSNENTSDDLENSKEREESRQQKYRRNRKMLSRKNSHSDFQVFQEKENVR